MMYSANEPTTPTAYYHFYNWVLKLKIKVRGEVPQFVRSHEMI